MNKFKKTGLRGCSRYVFELPEALKEDYTRLQLRVACRLAVYLQKLNDRILQDMK